MLINLDTGSTVTTLGAKPVFKLTGSTTGLAAVQDPITNKYTIVEGDGSGYIVIDTAVEQMPTYATITPNVAVKIPKELQHIKTINGVSPSPTGEFFIDGSECDSWDYLEGKAGISIVDLCPSCTTCENIYRLKYEVENLKMWLNTLKDVNLYLTAGGQDEVTKRAHMLEHYRVTTCDPNSVCGKNLQPDDEYLQMRGLQLLQQYITTVHMWNYIVSRNNASTLITVAPEDATGFTVQTKRALPSCGCEQTIQCIITVSQGGVITDGGSHGSLPDDYPLSIYVPDGTNEVRFEPLVKDQQDKALGLVDACTISTPNDNYNKPISDSKIADTTVIPVKVAGTYVVTVKFLPFVYYRAWRDIVVNGSTTRDYLNIRGGNYVTVEGNTAADGSVMYDFGITGHTVFAKPSTDYPGEPTEADYLAAKTVPTCSVTFRLVWNVNIQWIVTEGETVKKDTEDYVYVANGIRSYFGDIISGTTVYPVEPEPEPNQQGGNS